MVKRTTAICEGKIIGIETIFTINNGMQINIPEKLEELREKGRRYELFCPCGCGANLIPIASDKCLRRQHYREKSGTGKRKCTMINESETSINSKMLLKYWLDDKLMASDMESRVPIDLVEDTKRKSEFTFLSKEKKFAIRYWYARSNIIEDKIDILDGNLSGIKVVYIVDKFNGGETGQYPEALMKLQKRQNYCLLLDVNKLDYDKASMKAVFYDKDIDGFWKEIPFAKGLLKDYSINENNDVILKGRTLGELFQEEKNKFQSCLEIENKRRVKAEKEREENHRKQQEDQERRKQELENERDESENKLQEKRQKQLEKKKEEQHRQGDLKSKIVFQLSQQEFPVYDTNNNRWLTCEFCGKVATESEFNSYGGQGHVNLGTCKECSDNNPSVRQKIEEKMSVIGQKADPNKCPKCEGKLKEINGKFGIFFGCSNYPKCQFTRNI